MTTRYALSYSGEHGLSARWFRLSAETNFEMFPRVFSCRLDPQCLRASRTSENLDIRKNCLTAAVIFAASLVASADEPVTSKKWTQQKPRFDLLSKIYNQTDRLVAVHEKLPVDLGYKQL